MRTWHLLFMLLTSVPLFASYEMNASLVEAQKEIACLRLQKGKELALAEQKLHPQNLAVDLVLNYYDFYKVLLTRNKELFNSLAQTREQRISRFENAANKSPEIISGLAELHLQWSFIRSLYGEYISAAWDMKTADNYVKEGLEKFPENNALLKNKAIIETVVGMLPDKVQWMVSMIGFKGSLKTGITHLKEYLNREKRESFIIDRQNVSMLYIFMQCYLQNDKEQLWKETQAYVQHCNENLMEVFLKAYVANFCNRSDQVIEAIQNRPKGKDYVKFYYLDYMIGVAKMNKLDPEATFYLEQFLKTSDYETLYAETSRKLAWIAWLNKDTLTYQKWKKIELVHRKNEKESPYVFSQGSINRYPDECLLRARLLCDGGYYTRCVEALSDFRSKSDTATSEFYYRLGRAFQEIGQFNKAIQMFQKSIKFCPHKGYSFAASSELQLGYICKKLMLKDLAIAHFKRVQEADHFEHAEYFRMRAKLELENLGLE